MAPAIRPRSTAFLASLLLALGLLPALAGEAAPTGEGVLRARAGKSEIVVTTTRRLAGAIHSLTWDGKEFIDSFDHGRQLQSALNADGGKPFVPEVFNPTEAGSRKDGAGKTSSSKLLKYRIAGNELHTTTQMAFWLAPGEKSDGHPALNTKILSDHLLTKRVRLGYKKWPHAIEYDVTFGVPEGEPHKLLQFEAVTGYMPPEFSRFYTYRPKKGELVPLDDGPGEQEFPVVFATPDGAHAMGVFSPDQPSKGFEKAGYGRFRFVRERVVKWNCVFRVVNARGMPGGDYRFRCFVIVGALEDVRQTLGGLIADFAAP